jgi:hypothetical protein
MMHDLSHLSDEAADLAMRDNEERTNAIYQDRWVDYPQATYLLEVLKGVLARPRTSRMASVAIYADSGMGKTMLLEHFLDGHKSSFDRASGVEHTPVLSLQMVSRPNEKRFYTQVLDVIGAPPNPRVSLPHLEVMALRMLRHINLKMLLIDETHNILAATYNEQRAMLNLLRFISNELRVSVVCLGSQTQRKRSAAMPSLRVDFRNTLSRDGKLTNSSRRWWCASSEIYRFAGRRSFPPGHSSGCSRCRTGSPLGSYACYKRQQFWRCVPSVNALTTIFSQRSNRPATQK